MWGSWGQQKSLFHLKKYSTAFLSVISTRRDNCMWVHYGERKRKKKPSLGASWGSYDKRIFENSFSESGWKKIYPEEVIISSIKTWELLLLQLKSSVVVYYMLVSTGMQKCLLLYSGYLVNERQAIRHLEYYTLLDADITGRSHTEVSYYRTCVISFRCVL